MPLNKENRTETDHNYGTIMYIHVYIYIYICVCVCVYVCEEFIESDSVRRKGKTEDIYM